MQLTTANPLAKLKFGRYDYRRIYKHVELSDEQSTLADSIERMGRLNNVDLAPLEALNQPDYFVLTHVKGRRKFHTPVTDLLMNLDQPGQEKLFRVLADRAERADSTGALNAFRGLVDSYFYVLRPEGAEPDEKSRQALLETMKRLLSEVTIPAERRARFQDELKYGWLLFQRNRLMVPGLASDAAMALVERQVNPLLGIAIRRLPLSKHSSIMINLFKRAIDHPDLSRIILLSKTGLMSRLVPAWDRVIGPDNTQHSDQDFTLDGHILNTMENTRNSPYYLKLGEREKHLVTVAALFHDIQKHCGPANLRSIIPTDKIHPEKSSDTVRRILPSLGYNEAETDQVARLVKYHQAIGSMIVLNLGKPMDQSKPPRAMVERAANGARDETTLLMLCALTEGDIKSVKQNHAWFTPEVEAKLDWYAGLIHAKLPKPEEDGQNG